MPAPEKVQQLIETFRRNIDAYRTRYNETQLRREFIDPFFTALGWDVENKQGYAPAYKDVIHEDAIKIGASTEAPDYCFRIGGTRKFFLEAKKPSVNIKSDPHPAYQLRRYAWSAKLPLSVLTDFEEFAVYDCLTRPKQTDGPATARIIYLTYDEYIDQWDRIADIFSKDAVLKGSFDKFAASKKGKRGTATVDQAFLEEIETWRRELATSIARRNRSLSHDEVNFAVQRTIDRIIFLRMCEDRGIETYATLHGLVNGDQIYPRLFDLFRKADAKYNSGLFQFEKETGRHEPDELTPNIDIDDRPLRYILKSIYYPSSPYEFSVLPPEILGNVYEQFLGRVVRLTSARTAKVEEKPEVKKAGGVYYTPDYIVDYIVKNTVGKLCEGKSPSQLSSLKVLDPACGSGSFLLRAYGYLLDYHRDWYVENGPEKHRDKIYQGRGGQYFLTIKEKKRILLNSIFGVDIDPQAVEVSKLSLLLKVLEGESSETVNQTYKMFQERALPDLANNIKCGNSLIGPDFFDNLPPHAEQRPPVIASEAKQSQDLDDLHKKINPFDWKHEFPQIFNRKNPGFDAVIGNPPYVRIQTMKQTQPEAVNHFAKSYQSASKGSYDIYVIFVERALQLLNDKGRMGFILPHKFFLAQYGRSVRNLISNGKHLAEVVHFADQQVFEGATTYTCLLFLDKKPRAHFRFIKPHNLTSWRTNGNGLQGKLSADKVTAQAWSFGVGPGASLFDRLDELPVKLRDISAKIFQGLVTGADPVFIMENVSQAQYKSTATGRTYHIEQDLMHPLCKGSLNLRRYLVSEITKSILFPYKLVTGKAALLTVQEFKKEFPNAWAYLKENRQRLEAREAGKWKCVNWYAFGRSQNLTEMEQEKILTPSIANSASFSLDSSDGFYFVGSGGGGGGGYGITLKHEYLPLTSFYVLGLLNSKLLDWFLKQSSSPFRGGYYSYNRQYIELLPIRMIDFEDHNDRANHDQIVQLVERMLDLNKKLAAAKVPNQKTQLQRQIDATDKQIDRLVYKLYNLTDEEIAIVEQSN